MLCTTLSYGGGLNFLLLPGMPVYISDMVVEELRNGSQFSDNVQALHFIEGYLGRGIEIIKTGVPEIFDRLKELGVDPGDESIRRVINKYEEETEGEYALLVSEDDKFMRTADPLGRTFIMTTRPFLQELQRRNIIQDAEAIMIAAEGAAMLLGTCWDEDN